MSEQFVDYIPMKLNDENLTPWDGTRTNVEPGTYDFEIERTGFDQSRAGRRTLVVNARIITEGDMFNRQMRQSYVVSEDDFARRRMLSLVQATEAEVDDQGGFTAESLIGLQFTADVIQDEFKTVNEQTGQPEVRQVTKWVAERTVEGNAAGASTAEPEQAAASSGSKVRGGNPPRRPKPPNGAARR